MKIWAIPPLFHNIFDISLTPRVKLHIKKVREKSRECHNHNHKPQPFSDPKRKRKPTNLNKHKPNKRTKSTKISSLFPKRGNRNTKRTEKHKNKMTHGKTYNKSPRRINHKATKSKTNTGTTALERSVEQTAGGFKALLQLADFTLGPDVTLNTEIHKFVKWGCWNYFFLNSENLICRGTDTSKCFRESLGIRDNESRLYIRHMPAGYMVIK